MIELPTPVGMMTVTYGFDRKVKVPVFDEQQMRDYVAQAVAAERKACADACDELAFDWQRHAAGGPKAAYSACAAAIRVRGGHD